MKNLLLTILFAVIIISAFGQQLRTSWISQSGGNGWDVVTSITELSDGNIAIAGTYYDSISIGGYNLFSKGSRDCFIGIINPQGEFVKIRHDWEEKDMSISGT